MTLHKVLTSAALCLALGSTALQAQSSIDYVKRLTLKVGESAVVYGYRGECGKAPVASDVELPALATGTLTLGNPGFSDSNRCGGLTPAVEIVFTATTPGRESFELRGDKITVKVK